MKKESIGELIANAVSHGVGFLLTIAGLVIMLVKASGTREVISVLVFGLSLMILYLSSTLYHSFPMKMTRVRSVFRRLDHSSIFLLISGTYTPFLILVVNTTIGYILLGVLWVLTIVGIVIKSIWIKKFLVIQVIIYLFMGWSVLFVYHDFVNNINNFNLVLYGGIAYSLGVFFFASKFKYAHFIWHLAVLAGSILHFFAVLLVL